MSKSIILLIKSFLEITPPIGKYIYFLLVFSASKIIWVVFPTPVASELHTSIKLLLLILLLFILLLFILLLFLLIYSSGLKYLCPFKFFNSFLKMEFSLVKVINKTELIFSLYLVYKESINHKRY